MMLGILEWMYYYLFLGLQGVLVLVGLWGFAYWFSLKQRKSVTNSASLSSSPSISKEMIVDKVDDKDPGVVPDTSLAENIKPVPKITQVESNQIQVDLTLPSSPIDHTPSSTIPSADASLNNASSDSISDEVLAREERRRIRDAKRAARAARPEIAYRSPIEYLEDRCKLDVHNFHPYDKKKKCLVLDIDYTIFDHKSDFNLALEFKRPYLHEFLKICGAYYNIVIWSATAYFHIHTKMENLQLFNHPDFQICFVLSKDHMIPHGFSIKRRTYYQDIKPLSLLWMKYPEVFNSENTIHIDDVEENFVLNPSNGLRIDPFREALLFRQTDRELFYLAQYLTMIADVPSFSDLNHCRWKDYIINTLWNLQTVLSLPTFTPPDAPPSHLLEHHHQSLVIKQKLKEKAKDQEREDKMQRMLEDEKRKTQALTEAVAALGEVASNNNSNTNSNNNGKKEATEDELIKLAREAMEASPLPRSPSIRTPPRSPLKSPPRSPSSRTPPKSPVRSPLLSSSSPAFTPSLSTPTLSTPTLSSPSLTATPPKSPGRSKHTVQFLAIPTIHNFVNSQPTLSLSTPSPPKERRFAPDTIKERERERESKEKQESLAVTRGNRDVIIEKESIDPVFQIDEWSSPSFIPISLPLPISPIAHAAN